MSRPLARSWQQTSEAVSVDISHACVGSLEPLAVSRCVIRLNVSVAIGRVDGLGGGFGGSLAKDASMPFENPLRSNLHRIGKGAEFSCGDRLRVRRSIELRDGLGREHDAHVTLPYFGLEVEIDVRADISKVLVGRGIECDADGNVTFDDQLGHGFHAHVALLNKFVRVALKVNIAMGNRTGQGRLKMTG